MKKEYKFYVYILANYSRTVLYVGFTNNIIRRIIEHKNGLGSKFTAKYNLKYPIYYEETENVRSAIEREKEIKKWRREKKLELIKEANPGLVDLGDKLFEIYNINPETIAEIAKELKDNYAQLD